MFQVFDVTPMLEFDKTAIEKAVNLPNIGLLQK